jgi:hypothetical protein
VYGNKARVFVSIESIERPTAKITWETTPYSWAYSNFKNIEITDYDNHHRET